MYEYRCKVIKVIDGDTVDVDIDLGFDIVLKDERVRIMGIDTPESRPRDKVEKKFGLASKKYLKDNIAIAKDVVCKTHVRDARGKFGRVLGEIWCDGTNMNKQMIEENMAVAYYGDNKDKLEKQHLKNREILVEKGIVVL